MMDIRYTAEHEWLTLDGHDATVGISEHAQRALGDVVFVQLPEVGTVLSKGEVAGVVESVKAASDIYAPVSGRVIEANAAVVASPALINDAPLGAGWLYKIAMNEVAEFDGLMDADAYQRLTS